MVLFSLASKSLGNRKLVTGLTIVSIGLSVALLIGVERVRLGARESFSNSIRGTDLIVGARAGSIQLLLYTVFRIGSATNNITYGSYQKLKKHPAVAWTIPYSLGDSHRGYRVVATNEDFYRYYRYGQDRKIEFSEGRPPHEVFDVALGADVARTLNYRIGDRVVLTHGIGAVGGIMDHDDKPFRVVGILERTANPIDRSLYITLEGMEAMHIDWQGGAPPLPGQEMPADQIRKEDLNITQITAFLLGTKSRVQTLGLQREINNFADEPLMAIIPGVTLSELWQGIRYAEDALRIVSIFVVIIGLMCMLVALYTSLNERRREMAILRAVGLGPGRVISLLVLESGLLSAVGTLAGVVLIYVFLFLAQPIVERHFGIFLPIQPLTALEYGFLAVIIVGGLAIGLIPAWKAYRNALSDGLTVRV